MRTFFPAPTLRLLTTAALVFGSALALPFSAFAAKATKEVNEAKESGPILMSRTGGGGGWSDVKQLQEAVAKGNPKAEAQFGEMLLRGDGVTQDTTRGMVLLEKAARAGNSKAAFRLGMTLASGEFDVTADPVKALDYFRAAAAGGESEGFFNLGAAYASGKGVKRDYGEALGWLIVARQRGADGSAETQLRERIKAQKSWIDRGERRAKEIDAEFTGKKVQDFLPGAEAPAETKAQPSAAPSSDSLKPVPPSSDLLKPTLPSLPAPQIK
ncbi:MAG: tetratricopeptide repeat protein [Verrucomicrobiota bacterium]